MILYGTERATRAHISVFFWRICSLYILPVFSLSLCRSGPLTWEGNENKRSFSLFIVFNSAHLFIIYVFVFVCTCTRRAPPPWIMGKSTSYHISNKCINLWTKAYCLNWPSNSRKNMHTVKWVRDTFEVRIGMMINKVV